MPCPRKRTFVESSLWAAFITAVLLSGFLMVGYAADAIFRAACPSCATLVEE
jgi:hypothetical protein